MVALLTSAYLGPVRYYEKLAGFDSVIIERNENYVKQTYRNRCRISSANGVLDLSIPIKKDADKCPTKDIRIAYTENWQQMHWRAIESAYSSSPFFEYYRDDFEPFYKRHSEFLLDFNEELRQLVCSLIGLEPKVSMTDAYMSEIKAEMVDFRESFSPKKNVEEKMTPYYQVFSQKFGFLPDLSIIDLLFNMGPESILVLKK
ncbi:MAG: WbqC family protein [Paludibacteraceae bacterium]|nr:WbqC family protein [Paludibacteraceae bacterium]